MLVVVGSGWNPRGYKAWPLVGKVGDRLLCFELCWPGPFVARRCRVTGDSRRGTLRALLMPTSQVASSVLTMGVLVIATRRAELPEIAAYSAGAGIAALTATAVGGGTTLAFASGGPMVRASVRRVRIVLVVPVVVVAVVASAFVYSGGTSLAFLPVLFGGLTVAGSNLAELESAHLQGLLHTPTIALSLLASRVIGLVLVALGVRFSLVMLVASGLYFCLLALGVRAVGGAERRLGLSFTEAVRFAYRPSLMGIALLDSAINRLPFLVIPLVAIGAGAGAFASLLSAQQSLSAILISGLYTAMTVRSGSALIHPWIAPFEKWTVRLAVVAAVLGVVATPLVLRVFSLTLVAGAGRWWILFVLALPLYARNRRVQYSYVASGRGREALWLLLGVVGGVVLSCGLGVLVHLSVWVAVAPLLGEAVGLVVSVIVRPPSKA